MAGADEAPKAQSLGDGATTTRSTDLLAVASLVFGILWLAGLGALLAVILGVIALKRARTRHRRGRGIARAGIVLGVVGIAGAIAVYTVALIANNGTY